MRRIALSLSSFLTITLVLSLITADTARARPHRVAVLSVRGAGAKQIRRFLESVVEDRWRLRSRRSMIRAARKLGIRTRYTRPARLRRIARRAQVDAVISAFTFKRHGRWWIGVKVQDGGTGRTTKAGIAAYRYFTLDRRTKRRLKDLVLAGVTDTDGVPRETRSSQRSPSRRTSRKKTRRSRGRGYPHLSRTRDTTRSWRPAIQGGLGVSVLGRRLTLRGLDGATGNQKLYETSTPLYPVSLDLEVYPGAFASQHRFLANLGVGIVYQQAVGVATYREGETDPVGTTVFHLGGHVAYRWNLRQHRTSPELVFAFGVDTRQYTFGQDLGPVAGVRYLSLKPEVRAGFPLGTDRIRVQVRLAGLAVLAMGEIDDPYFYGQGRAGGFEAAVELDVHLFWRAHLRIGATTSWVFMRFPQEGTLGLNHEYTASWAQDGYYGGYVLAGFQY